VALRFLQQHRLHLPRLFICAIFPPITCGAKTTRLPVVDGWLAAFYSLRFRLPTWQNASKLPVTFPFCYVYPKQHGALRHTAGYPLLPSGAMVKRG
jgi:hypothetical protein